MVGKVCVAVQVFALPRLIPRGVAVRPSPIMVEFFATVINSFNDDTVRVFTTPASEVTISTELLEAGSALNVTVLFADKVVNAAVDGVVAPIVEALIGELVTVPPLIVRSLFTCVSVKPLPMRTAFTVVVPLFVDAINASP